MNTRRLYRSRYDRQIAGVAGGMAEYLELDPTVVRVAWILSAFLGGVTIVLYAILAFVIPLAPAVAGGVPGPQFDADGNPLPAGAAEGAAPTDGAPGWGYGRARGDRSGGVGLVVGVMFVVFGMIALADSVLPGWTDGGRLGPAILLALGAAVLVGSFRRTADER